MSAVYHFVCRHWLIRDLVTVACCTWMVFRTPRGDRRL